MPADLVLFSGGLDSTVCLALAVREAAQSGAGMPVAVGFDYGQRHRTELERAAKIAAVLGLERIVIGLDTRPWGGSALTDSRIEVPVGSRGPASIPVTYVPARNLIFLSVASAVAEARGLDRIFIGINAVDYSGYPDCRPEFVEAFKQAARLGLKRGVEGRPVDVVAPLVDLSKADIVRLGVELGAPLGLTWSCYQGGDRPCGECDACVLRARGFAEAGVDDPALSSS
jgi:7-cyano-7-deazaguanine synthase